MSSPKFLVIAIFQEDLNFLILFIINFLNNFTLSVYYYIYNVAYNTCTYIQEYCSQLRLDVQYAWSCVNIDVVSSSVIFYIITHKYTYALYVHVTLIHSHTYIECNRLHMYSMNTDMDMPQLSEQTNDFMKNHSYILKIYIFGISSECVYVPAYVFFGKLH